MNARLLILMGLIIGWLIEASAATYYVATGGSNTNPGTIDRPWATIAYAVNSSSGVSAGDTIYVRGGSYQEGNLQPEISGEYGNMINLWEYPGETVICDNSRITINTGINFWSFKGIRFSDGSGNGVKIEGVNRVTDKDTVCFYFEECEFKYMSANGVYPTCGIGQKWGTFKMVRCSVDSNDLSGVVIGGVEGIFWLHQDTIRWNGVKGISFFSNAVDYGVFDSSVVCSCYIWDNYEMGVGWAADSSYIMYNTIAWNGVRDPESDEWGDAGLRLDEHCEGTRVHHNLIRSSGRYELVPSGPGNIIYNNTIIKNHMYTTVPGSPNASTIMIFESALDGKIFKNNVITNYVPNEEHIYPIHCASDRFTGQDWDYNCWWSEYADSTAGNIWKTFRVGGFKTFYEMRTAYPEEEVHGKNADPLFFYYADSNYTLQQGSPCIDAGTDTICTNPLIAITDYYGDAPDMGAFEFYDQGNSPPWIDPPIQNFITDEDVGFGYDLTPHEHDMQQSGSALTWSISGLDPALAAGSVDPLTDLLAIAPVLNQSGSDDFLLSLSDGQGGVASQELTLTVNAVNDTPWIDPPIPDQIIENYDPVVISLLTYGHDVEDSSQDLSWEISDVDPTLFNASIDPVTKDLTLIPVLGAVGTDDVVLTVRDTENTSDDQEVVLDLLGPCIGPQISGLPDFYQPTGFMPPPLDLRNYVTCGTDSFEMLLFTTMVWDPQGVGTPDLIVSIKVGVLSIDTPTPDWQGTRLVAVRVEDTHQLTDEDTMQVTFSDIQVGPNYPQPDNPEGWQIGDSSQVVNADSFRVCIVNFAMFPEIASFQIKGGQYTTWLDAPGTEEFCFPLIPDSDNLLELRIRYVDGQFGPSKGVNIIEDSTPPSPPEGLTVHEEGGG